MYIRCVYIFKWCRMLDPNSSSAAGSMFQTEGSVHKRSSPVPFLAGRTLGSDTGLALPLERSVLIMPACPPSLFTSFFISCKGRAQREVVSGGGRGRRLGHTKQKTTLYSNDVDVCGLIFYLTEIMSVKAE